MVIVKNKINSFLHLKGKQLCHPGYNIKDPEISRLILQELELSVLEKHTVEICTNHTLTLLERHIKFLAGFFGDSCRPGPWTYNHKFDKILSK